MFIVIVSPAVLVVFGYGYITDSISAVHLKMARNVKCQSYWRTRRDILCSVDAYDFIDPPGGESPEEPLLETGEGETCTFSDDGEISNTDVNDGAEAYFYCDSDVCQTHDSLSESDGLCGSDCDQDEDLGNLIAAWVRQFNIPGVAVTRLLHILHTYHPSLPLDSRTMLGTPRIVEIKNLSGDAGYCHVGILKGIEKLFTSTPNDSCFADDTVELQINIDGLPIFKSSSMQLWPILGLLKGSSIKSPFTIGIYAGNSKPQDLTVFLEDFVSELRQLQTSGFDLNGRHFTVKIHSFVCDAPARAMLKNIKAHSGYHGCERCTQKGMYRGKVIFPEVNAPLRNNVAFDEMTDPDHHHGPSSLSGLSIGLVSQFCLDYMHLVCLGVTRRLLLMWIRGPLSCRLSAGLVHQISERMVALRHHVPCEFARKPRSLSEVDRWKATEFRQFLLYTGPLVLKGLLSDVLYKHFTLLSVAMYCCLRTDLCYQYSDYCHQLFVMFVNHAGDLYGKDILVYNVHALVHIADDVRSFGSLDNVSCFPFENHLGIMKKLIRSPTLPLQQIISRLTEHSNGVENCSRGMTNLVSKKHENGPIPTAFVGCHELVQFAELNTNGCVIKACDKDGCVILKGGHIAIVQNIIKSYSGVYVICRRVVHTQPFYDYPLLSSHLSIVSHSELSTECCTVPYHDIVRKCVRLPYKTGRQFIILPLAHNDK